MLCNRCSGEIPPNAAACPRCGASVQSADNAYAQQGYNNYGQQQGYNSYGQQPGYNYYGQQQGGYYPPQQNPYGQMPYDPEDYASGGMKFLAFLIPLVGIILYCTEHNTHPNKAKALLKMAIISWAVGIVITIFTSVLAVLLPTML